MQEASDAHSKTADSDTVSTYQVSSVQLVTDKKLEAFNKAFVFCSLVKLNLLFQFSGHSNGVLILLLQVPKTFVVGTDKLRKQTASVKGRAQGDHGLQRRQA